MYEQTVIFSIFLIFSGAAVLATAFLYLRQAIIVAYILVGMLLGPVGIGLVPDSGWIEEVSSIGMIFLLYLLGLNMEPRQLLRMFGESFDVTLVSSFLFLAIGFLTGVFWGLPWREALIVGACMMFSSTIIGLKLLPTTTLHHQRTGQMIISILLLQDLIAIVVLLMVNGPSTGYDPLIGVLRQIIALPLLIVIAMVLEKKIMEPLIARFDGIHEYLFLLVVAWCLMLAELSSLMGLSHEIGAFIAGVALASCPIANFIADNLRPLRDFFLVIFFFSIGAGFDLSMVKTVWLPACLLALSLVIVKPYVFKWLFVRAGERKRQSLEVGVRLGQTSEFSLLIAMVALNNGLLGQDGSFLIQLTTLITLIFSCFLIVRRYPSPIATRESLRRD